MYHFQIFTQSVSLNRYRAIINHRITYFFSKKYDQQLNPILIFPIHTDSKYIKSDNVLIFWYILDIVSLQCRAHVRL